MHVDWELPHHAGQIHFFFFFFFFAVIKNIFSVVLLFIVHTTEPVTNLSVALISGRAQN